MKTIDIILQVSFKLNSKNEQRKKKRLSEVSNMIGDAIDEIADIMEEEQEAFDNLPKSLQSSSKGDKTQEYVDNMQGIMDDLTSRQTDIDNLTKK
jgi:hypothetical protein